MKKVFNILTIVCLGVFCAVLALSLTRRQVVATEGEKTLTQQVGELLSSYVGENKQYTKLTTLHYSLDSANYHAGANNAQRRTYYDEKVNALLMGDYDGGFEKINSGYAQVVDDMAHYKNNASTITTKNLFTSMKIDWKVNNTNPILYFDVLSEIATFISSLKDQSKWSNNCGVYQFTASSGLKIVNGDYSDGLLKMLQYFAAPMLLVNESVQLQKVVFFEADATIGEQQEQVLVIKLLGTDDAPISTAYVVNHLTMDEVEVEMLKLDATEWDAVGEGARYAVLYYTWVSEELTYQQWSSMMPTSEKGIYETELMADFNNFLFVRRDAANHNNAWDDDAIWGQSFDLVMNQRGNIYHIINYNSSELYAGDWDIELQEEYVLAGDFNSWNHTAINFYQKTDGSDKLVGFAYFNYSKFKVVAFGNWNNAYPGTGDNDAYYVGGTGQYYITFDKTTHDITCNWSFN